MAELTMTIECKALKRFKIATKVLKTAVKCRLLKAELAVRAVTYMAQRGWVAKMRLDNGKWRSVKLNVGEVSM